MKDKPTSFRFDESLKQALATVAARESRSVSNAIEWMAKEYFKKHGLPWPSGGSVDAAASPSPASPMKKKDQDQ